MFRYICPVILAGGESSRFGINKIFFSFKDLSFLDFRLNFLFDIGFCDIVICGICYGYSFLFDEYRNKGPVSGCFTILLNKLDEKFSHFLFIPVDMVFFCKRLFFYFFLTYKFFYSYSFNNFFLPLLLSFSFNTFWMLLNLCLLDNVNFVSFKIFFKFILFDYFNIEKFNRKFFLNLNSYYNLTLYVNYIL